MRSLLRNKVTHTLFIVFFVCIILLAIVKITDLVSSDSNTQAFIAQFGYAGILLIAIVSGFNIFIPIPAAAFIPIFVAAGLWMPLIILMLIIGTTIADIAGYAIGKLSKVIASEYYPQTYARIFLIHENHHRLLLPFIFFYAAFAPFPNEAFLIPLALIGVQLRTFIIPLILGTTVNQLLFAYGVQNIFEALF